MKKYFSIYILVFALLFFTKSVSAGGVVYGDNYAFAFETPNGWILDTKAGVPQGLHAVLYPRGYSWNNSPVIIYTRGVPRTKKHKEILDFVKETLTLMKANSPNVTAKLLKFVKLDSGVSSEIYAYENDKWGNKELVAYFLERLTINFFVLSAHTEFAFNKAQESFQFIVNSYEFISDKVDINKNK